MLSFRKITCWIICVASAVYAQLPDNFIINGLDGTGVRLAQQHLLRFEPMSTQNFYPYFNESVNAVLRYYGNTDTLTRHMSGNSDTTLAYYINKLAEDNITIYRMDKLQGKSIRALLCGNIPVLLLGTSDMHLYNKKRLHADILCGYRPSFTRQSSRVLKEDIIYVLYSVRGIHLNTREKFPPASMEMTPAERAELNHVNNDKLSDLDRLTARVKLDKLQTRKWAASPLKKPPYDTFAFFCVITTPQRTLQDIKKVINTGLSDAGLEYKIPEFRKLNINGLTR